MRIDVLGVGFDNLTLAEAAERGMELLHTEGARYVVTPNPEIVEVCREDPAAREAVNGADLVLGNHPHVLQPREVYKGKEIVYSLGNFCFGGSRGPENRTIIYQLILRVENGELVSAASELIPCYVHTGGRVNNYCPAPIEDEAQARRVLDFMDGKAKLPL